MQTPTRPLNPDALGPMYEALKAATTILCASLHDMSPDEALDMELVPDGSVKLSDCYAALALAEKGEAS